MNSRSLNDRKTKHYEHLTHAYALWAANVLLAVFAPAFPLSFHDRKLARRPPKPIASVVMAYSKKRKKTDLLAEKSLTNCPLSVGLYEFSVKQNLLVFKLLIGGQFLADFKGKNWTFSFYDYKPERLKS